MIVMASEVSWRVTRHGASSPQQGSRFCQPAGTTALVFSYFTRRQRPGPLYNAIENYFGSYYFSHISRFFIQINEG